MAPEFGKPIYQLTLIPADVLKNISSTNRSIGLSVPPHTCCWPGKIRSSG